MPTESTGSPVEGAQAAPDGWRLRTLGGFIESAGPLWTRREPDGWAYAIRMGPGHLNPAGVVHGGVLLTLMDHALSAIAWEAAERARCVTLQIDSQFIAPVQSGDFVEARGAVTKRTSGLVFVRGSLSVGDTDVLSSQAIMRVLRPSA